jgi:hypothetical protein
MKVFSSGSCRLLINITNGHDKIVPIHSMIHNFLGKLHNTKQHIQFIRFIKEDTLLPDDILSVFLTAYSKWCPDRTLNKENLKNQFNECEWYIIEICSLKLYKKNGYEVQFEHTDDYDCILQTEEELLEDLHVIKGLIPMDKKILFQVHFRPNIIYNDESKTIEKREIIYNVIKSFCEKNKNTFLYDPSILLETDHSLFDGDTHFTERGYVESFNYIYNNYLNVFV